MNEKTKQILRYIACGLGGVALGIGLLGGLAMCASSGKSTKAEDVNTFYASPKGEQINTGGTAGNYTGYRFTITSNSYGLSENYVNTRAWTVDRQTYTLSNMTGETRTLTDGYANIVSSINNWNTQNTPTETNELRFVLVEGYTALNENGTKYHWHYFSFLSANATNIWQKAFVLKDLTFTYSMKTTAQQNAGVNRDNPITINNEPSQFFVFDEEPLDPNQEMTFQDVVSYYKSLGYADGYGQGYTDGDNVGYWAGYNEGIGTASSFTDISGNLNAVYDLTTMGILSPTWQNLHGLTDVKIHTLLQFFDNDQNTWDCYIVEGVSSTQPTGTRTMYVDVAQLSSSNPQTIGFAIYTTASNVGLQEVGTAHFEFAQIRNVNNKSLAKKLILLYGWTQNDVSYQAGYQAGLKDGFENTNTNNVFSLFTGAFDAVGGFFNLKIFGFLPLYWFFLTPLFVAIITLLLRMVKH